MQLDMAKYKEYLDKNPTLKEGIEAITHSNIADFMAPLPFLKGIKETQRSMLAAMCKYEALDTGEDLFREGDEGDKIYILLQGSCSVIAYRDKSIISSTDREFRSTLNHTKNGEIFSDASDRPSLDSGGTGEVLNDGSETPGDKEKVRECKERSKEALRMLRRLSSLVANTTSSLAGSPGDPEEGRLLRRNGAHGEYPEDDNSHYQREVPLCHDREARVPQLPSRVPRCELPYATGDERPDDEQGERRDIDIQR